MVFEGEDVYDIMERGQPLVVCAYELGLRHILPFQVDLSSCRG